MSFNILISLVSNILIFFVLSFPLQKLIAQIPAFPGAEGFGNQTPGGRGGKIIAVTNLNPAGPGSLRQALQNTSGPRIIIFKTAGIINLKRNISVKNPYVTVAGQTAPGDGITIKGAAIAIKTHDVVLRYLRIRIGDNADGPDPENRDGIAISNNKKPIHNIIIDHCSVSWAIDENIQLYYECSDITIQWCIISEGLRYSLHPKGEHSNGILVGSGGETKRISIHHNLFAHNYRRNPVISDGNSAEIINNVIYNWRIGTTVSGKANVIGNIYIPGFDTGKAKGIILPTWRQMGMLYVKDNIGPGRFENNGDEWSAVKGPISNRSYEKVFPLSNLKVDNVKLVKNLVLKNAGATKPKRDIIDQRIVRDVETKSGRIIDSQNEVGAWVKFTKDFALPDSDNDGMPDFWECRNKLNPFDPNDVNGDINNDGYTNIENYLNQLAE